MASFPCVDHQVDICRQHGFYKGIPLQYKAPFFIYFFRITFFLCEVFVNSFTTFFLLESVKRCGDVLSLVITLLLCPILRSPEWFVNVVLQKSWWFDVILHDPVAAFLWPFFWGGFSPQNISQLQDRVMVAPRLPPPSFPKNHQVP